MYVSFPLIPMLLFLGLAQAVFLAFVYLRTSSENPVARRLMVALLCSLALSICNGLLYQTNLYQDAAWLIGIPPIFQLLIGPAFFLYFKALTIQGFRLRPIDLLHLIPAFVYVLCDVSFLSQGALYKMVLMYSWINHERGIAEYLSRFWFEFLIPLQLSLYLFFVWVGVRRHEQRIRQQFSTIEGLTLTWLWRVIIAFCLGLAGITAGYVLLLFGVQFDSTYLFSPIADAVVVYYLAWVSIVKGVAAGMVKMESATPQEAEKDEQTSFDKPKPKRVAGGVKYEKNALPEHYGSQLLTRLETEMREKKPYLDPDLTLAGLAEHIRASRNHLSQILNQRLKTSFYDYVNNFRIREAAKLLVDEKRRHHEIVRIAADSGFNSKSTFNKAFKHWYGVSPSEYRLGVRIPPNSWIEGDRGTVG